MGIDKKKILGELKRLSSKARMELFFCVEDKDIREEIMWLAQKKPTRFNAALLMDQKVECFTPIFRLIRPNPKDDRPFLEQLFVRRPIVDLKITTVRKHRFAEAVIGKDGLRFCKDCEKWYEADQMDRPSQCRSCRRGGN